MHLSRFIMASLGFWAACSSSSNPAIQGGSFNDGGSSSSSGGNRDAGRDGSNVVEGGVLEDGGLTGRLLPACTQTYDPTKLYLLGTINAELPGGFVAPIEDPTSVCFVVRSYFPNLAYIHPTNNLLFYTDRTGAMREFHADPLVYDELNVRWSVPLNVNDNDTVAASMCPAGTQMIRRRAWPDTGLSVYDCSNENSYTSTGVLIGAGVVALGYNGYALLRATTNGVDYVVKKDASSVNVTIGDYGPNAQILVRAVRGFAGGFSIARGPADFATETNLSTISYAGVVDRLGLAGPPPTDVTPDNNAVFDNERHFIHRGRRLGAAYVIMKRLVGTDTATTLYDEANLPMGYPDIVSDTPKFYVTAPEVITGL